MNNEQDIAEQDLSPEPEHRGSMWTHPYVLYLILTLLLFLLLLLASWYVWSSGLVPNRGFR